MPCSGYLCSLLLECFEVRDDAVVIQDAPLHVVEGLQQRLLELAQSNLELSLQLEQVRTLLVHVRALGLQHLGKQTSLGRKDV